MLAEAIVRSQLHLIFNLLSWEDGSRGGVEWNVNDPLCVSRSRPNRLTYTDAKEMNTIVRPNRNIITSQICITDLTYL